MNKQVTLWQLLTDSAEPAVTIPMIQRDYAQGRPGKEHILGSFLTDILNCLSGNTNSMTLDFVYGNADNNSYYPLDGQQRLTTLWLVHWYLAFRLGYLKDEKIKNALKRFSYQTRNSSMDFCKELCDEMAEITPDGIGNVTKHIIGQAWFFADWLQDPTVNAMLRALGGDIASLGITQKETDKLELANIDDIFKDADCALCWENLTTEKKITFQRMVIGTDQLPLSDDLYIKMNARGKKLTDFENFKADLVAHIQTLEEIKNKLAYSTKLDGDWTDIFWNDRKNEKDFDGNIDPLFFLFINRFVLNQHCLQDIPPSNYDASKTSADNEDTKVFNILYGSKLGKKGDNDDSLIEYKGFDVYRKYMTPQNLTKLDNIFNSMKIYAQIIRELDLSSTDEVSDNHTVQPFRFLPYFKDNILKATGLKERIYFHSICLFLESPSQTDNRLEGWLRLVRNLTENAAIDNIEYMITCLRLVNRLGLYLKDKDWDIFRYLGDFAKDNRSMLPKAGTALGDQFVEELEKAAKINDDPSWKEKIITAEGSAIFKGTIRFLYTGPDSKPDWENFDTKLSNAVQFFPKNNVVEPETIKLFLKQFTSFDDLNDASNGKSYFFTTIGFHTRNVSWKKNILCNTEPKVIEKVHRFLLRIENTIITDKTYEQFLESSAVEYLSTWSNNYKYRYHDSKDWGILRDNHATEGIFTTPARLSRNKLLLKLEATNQIQFTHDDISLGQDFLWGKEIYFIYNGKEYCWYADWDRKNWIRIGTQKDRCFEWTDNLDTTTLLVELQKLQST